MAYQLDRAGLETCPWELFHCCEELRKVSNLIKNAPVYRKNENG